MRAVALATLRVLPSHMASLAYSIAIINATKLYKMRLLAVFVISIFVKIWAFSSLEMPCGLCFQYLALEIFRSCMANVAFWGQIRHIL